MTQITITISDNVKEIIEDMAEHEGKSFSRMCGDLIDRGMTHSNINAVKQLSMKNMEYAIRTLNIATDLFFKARKIESPHLSQNTSPEKMLEKIALDAKEYVEKNF